MGGRRDGRATRTFLRHTTAHDHLSIQQALGVSDFPRYPELNRYIFHLSPPPALRLSCAPLSLVHPGAMQPMSDVPMLYAASCNPPRRAKRQRTGSLGADAPPATPSPTASSSPLQRRASGRPPILPKQPAAERDYAPAASLESDSASEEDDYDPGREAAPPPKRRGRKPGNMSRSARESLRKLNHSRIEKARRTKINETLSTLSTLVGERERVLPVENPEVSAPQPLPPPEETGKKGKGKTEEKEFKLDVLVKTVEYMQDLVARVQALETKMCTDCRVRENTPSTVPPSPKRKRPEEYFDDVERTARRLRHTHDEEDSYGGDDEHGLGAAEEEQPSPMPFANPAFASRSTASPRLPPIASWLPHPYVDPSSLINNASPNAQLPSPPPSGRFRPSITLANMPALALPAPAHPLAPAQSSQRTSSPKMLPPRQQRKSVSASPTVSPTWTPEDETAASLLLQMSSKPRSSSTSSSSTSGILKSTLPTPMEEAPKDRVFNPLVVTPSSLLGMID